MQPLDVAVFALMKRKWREVLGDWKEKCAREGNNYATLVKSETPPLLKQLLEKDYSQSIRSGFESCGIFPLNLERALSKLPPEDREDVPAIQQQLINQLSTMRYQQPETTRAPRPKKKEKLPAGAAYTCPVAGEESESEEMVPVEQEEEMQEMEEMEKTLERQKRPAESAESDGESDGESAVRRLRVHNIIERLGKRFRQQERVGGGGDEDEEDIDDDISSSSSSEEEFEEEVEEEEMDEPNEPAKQTKVSKSQRRKKGNPEMEYAVGSYVAAVYQGAWHIGQVLDKEKEKKALVDDDYVFLRFMQWVVKDRDNF